MAPTDPGVPRDYWRDWRDWGSSETTSADTQAMIIFGGIFLFGLIMFLVVLCN